MSDAKPFNLGDVLSITTGRLVSPRRIEGVYDILNHMTGDNLYTHQLGRAAKACKPALLADHPFLVSMGDRVCRSIDDAKQQGRDVGKVIRDLIVELYLEVGSSDIMVLPLGPDAWLSINPIQELAAMVGEDRMIVVRKEAADV